MSSAASNITSVLKETRAFPPPAGVRRQRPHQEPGRVRAALAAGQGRSGGLLGRTGRIAALVQALGQGARSGTSRTPSGSSAASSTPATTASTGTWPAGRKNKAAIIWEGEPGDSRVLTLSGSAPRGLQVRQRPQGAGHQGRRPRHDLHADGSRAGRSPCWPAPASARRTASSSAASAPRPSPIATTTPRRGSSSPPTAAGGAARSCRSSRTSMQALAKSPTVEKCIVFNRCNQQVDMKPGRDLWWHELMADASRRLPRRAARQRASALHPLHQRLDRQTQGRPAHHRRLPARRVADASMGLRPARRGHLLVYRRHRLGDGPQLHRLRPAVPTAPPRVMYEGAPNHPREDRFWEIIEKYRVNIFYTAPTAIRAFVKWGDEWPNEARPVEPAPARHGRRADQSRGVDVVSRGDRQQALPHRRYLVADGNRHDHDRAAARRHRRPSPARRRGRCPASSPTSSIGRARPVPANQGGLLVIQQAVAGDAAHHLRRRRALPAAILEPGAALSTSPPTAPAATRTATSGSWAASTTCSTSPAIASARWRSRAPWCIIPRSPRPRSSASRTRSRARASPVS